MIARSALGCEDRTVCSSGSSTGLVSVRGPPKRANLARTREDVGTGPGGWAGVGGVIMPGTPVTISSLIGEVYGP